MANQRKKGKKKIGFWATDAEKAKLLRAAKKAGFKNLAEWLRSLIDTGSKVGIFAVMSLVSLHLTRNPKKMVAAFLAETAKGNFSKLPRSA